MSRKDYYKTLEVPKTASQDDIKKAYRKLAIKWHPDKNPDSKEQAEIKFKEIAEAYDCLSDPDKRSTFDRYGAEGLRQRSGGGGGGNFHGAVDPNDIFRAFFGDGDFDNIFAQAAGGRRGGPVQFQTFNMGGGSGFTFSSNMFSGFEPQQRRRRVALPCTIEELYTGTKKRRQVQASAYEVEVPAGTKAGDILNCDSNSNLTFQIQELPHDNYARDGNNLVYTAVVYPHELLLGTTLTIRLPDAKQKSVVFEGIMAGIRSITLRGLGMPDADANGRRGDLVIVPSLVTPRVRSTVLSVVKGIFMLWLMTLVYSNPSLFFLLLCFRQFFL